LTIIYEIIFHQQTKQVEQI